MNTRVNKPQANGASSAQTVAAPAGIGGLQLAGVPVLQLVQVIEQARDHITKPLISQLYQGWLAANPGSGEQFWAWFNLGVVLSELGDNANAITAYQNALVVKPDLYQAALNLGLLYERNGDAKSAILTWSKMLQPDEPRIQLLNQIGRLSETNKLFELAERSLRNSLLMNPHQPDAIQHWVHLRQKMCIWPPLASDLPGSDADELAVSIGPLGALALYDDVDKLCKVNRIWLERKVPPTPEHLAKGGYQHERVRVGYLSSDFCSHAMSYLIAELFERHDRSRFEIYGYCMSREDGSEVRKRVIAAFDHFTIIKPMSDEQAARKIREDEIDILIDLNGLTLGARMGILRWKPAPVQMTYLGYIGPIPLPELDYILCDNYVIPPEQAAQYHPKPLPLPRVYQANDTKLQIGEPMTRAEAGLPEDKFVYCCFSHHYKITEEHFADWMEILKRTDNSVLWLIRDNPWSCARLHAAAARMGVDTARVVFADRVPPEKYLARLVLADLFLDTIPYNAGTIASDALRMGVPLVTLSGQTFSARMAGSLLTAVGLPDLVTHTREDYVNLAVSLSGQPERLASIRRHLTEGEAWMKGLGDIGRFAKELEDVYLSVVR